MVGLCDVKPLKFTGREGDRYHQTKVRRRPATIMYRTTLEFRRKGPAKAFAIGEVMFVLRVETEI